MFEMPIDYPCAVADESRKGCDAALEWVKSHQGDDKSITLWVPKKKMVNNNHFLQEVRSTQDVQVFSGYEDDFFEANGPVLAMYPRVDDLGKVIGALRITALCLVRSPRELDTFVAEAGAEVLSDLSVNEGTVKLMDDCEPPLSPEVVAVLEQLTLGLNHNNLLKLNAEKTRVVSALLKLYDDGYVLPSSRMTQWAAAHGWFGDAPKVLGDFARRISNGERPRTYL